MKKNSSVLKRVLFVVMALSLFTMAWAQSKTITGVVKDATGESIIGASVLVKGTNIGTVTNVSGAYTLSVPESAKILVISYVGLETKEIAITGSVLNVTLADDSKGLEELVVVGYGVMKKRDLTGSISSIKASELQSVASNNAMEAMQGKIPGLDITKSSGSAGSGISINLRGNRSISASNDPLILVDGIEYGSTIDLNTSDIESMEVLKDASSTAIYGTRGANGVVIITTKKGVKGGKTRVSYSGYVSANSPTNIPRTMSAEQDVNFLIERARLNSEKAVTPIVYGSSLRSSYTAANVLSGTTLNLYNEGIDVDWFDLILRNSTSNNHEFSVAGGSEKTSFNLSLGYLNEMGLMKNDDLNRYNAKLNIDHSISKSLNVGASMLFTKRDWNRRQDGVYSQLLKMHAIADISKDQPSELAPSHTNPLINERDGYYQNNTQSNRFFGNAFMNWQIIKGLSFKTMFAADMQNSKQGIYEDYMCTGRNQSNRGTGISQEYTDKTNLTWDNTLNYSKLINGIHDFQGLLGQSINISETVYNKTAGTAGNVHFFQNGYYDLGNITRSTLAVGDPDNVIKPYSKSTMSSYFGRVNYKLYDRYLLTASLRADGSSVLADGKKWGYFPSVAVAWRLNDESFLKEVKQLDNLKLRVSWGKAGNAAVDPYGTLTTLSDVYNYYTFGESSASGLIPGNLGNKNLTWETTATYDLGLDFGLFNNRITGSVDVYYSQTSDLLMLKTLPATSVYITAWDNVGATENKGIEIALNTRNIDTKNFKWSSDWSFSLNRDKVVSLANGLTQDVSNPDKALVVGQSVKSFYDYETLGVWGTDEVAEAAVYGKHPGQLKVKDQQSEGETGYGVINADDRILYNQSPDFIFGWNNHFSYKNFELSVLTFARVGQWIEYELYEAFNPTVADGTPDLDFWTPENQDARFPRPGEINTAEYSSLSKVNASYWKIKDISLSYTLPKTLTMKAGISNVKVYGSLKNYFTFSNMENYDPEQNGRISNPLMKQIVFGLNLEF